MSLPGPFLSLPGTLLEFTWSFPGVYLVLYLSLPGPLLSLPGPLLELTWSFAGVYLVLCWSLPGPLLEFTWSFTGVYLIQSNLPGQSSSKQKKVIRITFFKILLESLFQDS